MLNFHAHVVKLFRLSNFCGDRQTKGTAPREIRKLSDLEHQDRLSACEQLNLACVNSKLKLIIAPFRQCEGFRTLRFGPDRQYDGPGRYHGKLALNVMLLLYHR